MARYRNFFGIQSDAQLEAEADRLKQGGDFTSPDNFDVHPNPPTSLSLDARCMQSDPRNLILTMIAVPSSQG